MLSSNMYRMSKADVTGQPQGFVVSSLRSSYSLLLHNLDSGVCCQPLWIKRYLEETFSLSSTKSIWATRSSTTSKTVNSVIKKANSKVIIKGSGTTSSSPTGRTGTSKASLENKLKFQNHCFLIKNNQDWDTSQLSIVDVALVSAAIHSSRSDHYSWQFFILLKTLASWAQHDKTLQETVIFRLQLFRSRRHFGET